MHGLEICPLIPSNLPANHRGLVGGQLHLGLYCLGWPPLLSCNKLIKATAGPNNALHQPRVDFSGNEKRGFQNSDRKKRLRLKSESFGCRRGFWSDTPGSARRGERPCTTASTAIVVICARRHHQTSRQSIAHSIGRARFPSVLDRACCMDSTPGA